MVKLRLMPTAAPDLFVEEILAPSGEFWTDEELIALPDDEGQRYELWDGELIIMSPASLRHEEISFRLLLALGNFADQHRAGQVYGGNAGFRLDRRTMYAPDVSFVSKERWRVIRYDPDKYANAAPDLAVEVLSPSDTIRQTESKIADYFAYGTCLAWLVNPRRLQVRVYHRPGEHLLLEGSAAELDGGDVLPGFKYSLGRLFTTPILD